MEVLQQLSRRQVDALEVVGRLQDPHYGASLNAIAEALKVRPPSALEHLTVLENLGLVDRHRGKTRVTPRGTDCLAEYRRHHRVAENLFHELGLPVDETCLAAREVDLALSHRTVERLCRAGGHPSRCPHGQTIDPCRTDPVRR